MPDYYLSPSTRKNKRYMVELKDGTKVHFGAPKGSTFIDHQDTDKKAAWIARHSKLGEDWTKDGIKTAGFWSHWLLWSRPTLKGAINQIRKKFNLSGMVRLS